MYWIISAGMSWQFLLTLYLRDAILIMKKGDYEKPNVIAVAALWILAIFLWPLALAVNIVLIIMFLHRKMDKSHFP